MRQLSNILPLVILLPLGCQASATCLTLQTSLANLPSPTPVPTTIRNTLTDIIWLQVDTKNYILSGSPDY